jgi:3-isopropylmalate/(R)-2-methylmalate dehydratase large subunit
MGGMTAAQKIFAAHSGRQRVEPGEILFADYDILLLNDVSGPYAISQFHSLGRGVKDPERIVLVNDHFAPPKDVESADGLLSLRRFARGQGIRHMYEQGGGGIEHTLLPQLGLVRPGQLIVGGDSHTCTYGALGALGIGMGSSDLAASMALGRLWFTVPETMRFVFTGERPPYITGKDLILTILGEIGVDGAGYRCMEFSGETISTLPLDDRLALCNMSVEAGAKACIVPADAITLDWLRDKTDQRLESVASDADASFHSTRTYDVSTFRPVVAKPYSPGNVAYVEDVPSVKVDQVYIGNCANGTISDLRQAASILGKHRVNPEVRCVVVPATQMIYKQAIKEGLIDIFIDAGAVVSPPTCGACAGLHMGVLASEQVAVANTNRNFRGRMGHRNSQVYLANSYVCAATAVAGELILPSGVV